MLLEYNCASFWIWYFACLYNDERADSQKKERRAHTCDDPETEIKHTFLLQGILLIIFTSINICIGFVRNGEMCCRIDRFSSLALAPLERAASLISPKFEVFQWKIDNEACSMPKVVRFVQTLNQNWNIFSKAAFVRYMIYGVVREIKRRLYV